MKLYVFLSVFPSNYDVVINAGSSAIFVGMIRCFLLLDSKQRTYGNDFVKSAYVDRGNNKLIVSI